MREVVARRLLTHPVGSAHKRALLIAGVYCLAAAGWVLVGDWLLNRFVTDPALHRIGDTAKGAIFVVVTAALLYVVLRAYLGRADYVTSHLDLLARRSTDMIFRYQLHPRRGYEYVSPAAEALTGYSPAEHYADPELPLRIVHPDHKAELRAQFQDPERLREREEVRWVRRDGTVLWVELHVHLVRESDGRIVAVEGIARDVTARRRRERRRRILEAAVEAGNDSVVITNDRGTIEYVNPAFTRMTGWIRTAAVGRNPRILRSGVQDRAFYQRMWSTLRAGRSFRGRFVNRRADGSLYTQEATITPLAGPSGRIEHYVAVAHDVTEREAIERQLREAQMAEVVGQFVAGVSHDFRNLLGTVLAQVELAGTTEAEGRYPAEELAEIARATERGVELVRKLLTLGRSGEVALASASMVEIVSGLRMPLAAVLPARTTLDVVVPEDDALIVHVDRGAIEQILLNLVGNARDALPRGGTIVVEAARTATWDAVSGDAVVGSAAPPPGGWVRVRVRDDGDGMEPAVLRRIFEPFYTTKPTGQGTGLGMPMVARLARLHEGAVAVHSRPGGGTTVSLLLPALPATEAAMADAPRDWQGGEIPRGHGQQVLVVDDEAALLDAQVKALERLGYRTLIARDGDEAVRLLRARSMEIELVMTDLMMPGRGGVEVYDEMGVLGLRHIPVVFMSGYASSDAALPSGTESNFLEKPWTIAQLAQKVAAAL